MRVLAVWPWRDSSLAGGRRGNWRRIQNSAAATAPASVSRKSIGPAMRRPKGNNGFTEDTVHEVVLFHQPEAILL